MPAQIDHVIVLMMENRSFDHMFGFLDHPDPKFRRLTAEHQIAGVTASSSAYYEVHSPDHSHRGVMQQLFGGETFEKDFYPEPPYPTTNTNRGFLQNYEHRTGTRQKAEAIMRCFHPGLIPVMSGLAREYALCTRWFCSLPGETWPNRDFVTSARSFGKANQSYKPRTTTDTIFHRLSDAGASWRIYHDAVAQTWLYTDLYGKGAWAGMDRFFEDVKNDALPAYSFIEPDYGIGSTNWFLRHIGFTRLFGDTYGNSHHPDQAKSAAEFLAGEYLIAGIYNALVRTMTADPDNAADSLFARTLFVITYDEHGGFYDHVTPPAAPQPTPDDVTDDGFRFDVLGPRVPALLISPWIKRGTLIDTVFDHSSIPATVRKLFAPDEPALTARDEAAKTFEGVLGDQLRTPWTAEPIYTMTPLSPAEAEEQAELHAASPNPADLRVPDTELRRQWEWLAEHANAQLGPQGLTPATRELVAPDDFARRVTELMHAVEGPRDDDTPVGLTADPARTSRGTARSLQPSASFRPSAFIVHGRDHEARIELEKCLTAMGMRVDRFEEIADRSAALPIISSVIRDAIVGADVVVVLFTPDEQAVHYDTAGTFVSGEARWQARPNVIFEAGWAFGLRPDHTVFVSIGTTSLFADIAGHHVIPLDQPGGKHQLRRRLEHVLAKRVRFPLSDTWLADSSRSGDFSRVVRRRWSYYDDLGGLAAKLANMSCGKTTLGALIESVIRSHPDWDWSHRSPRDLIKAIKALERRKIANEAFWWLTSIGFFRLSDITDWGDDYEESIDIASFSPRTVVFLEWLRARIGQEPPRDGSRDAGPR